jgi:pimeloyl-ACP methyl ester carboxylesterase
VLVHGALERSRCFAGVLGHLADLRVVTYDRRGYGGSIEARPATGMADHADDLLGIVDRIGGRCVVVAHSFGSNPTMLAATRRPSAFRALGMYEAPLPWTHLWPDDIKEANRRIASAADPAAAAEEMHRRILGDRRWEALPADARARRLAEGRAVQVDLGSELTEPFRFADVRVPALVGCGGDTEGLHGPAARWLAEQLPDARLHVVPGTAHLAPRTHPAAFATFVRATLSLAPP